jgi:nucleoside-diphosphate-sugar epimerase
MHFLITGGAGFIGQLLAQALLNHENNTVLLTDIVDPPIPGNVKYPKNARTLKADIGTAAESVVQGDLHVVYILHAIMSAQSETNFELGVRVNIDATRRLLEALRRAHPGVRVIYMSSQAVYGRPFPEKVDESVRPVPESSYGAEKLMCETLINDYTRRGFVEGYILRLPNVAIRPGKPSAAASAFISGIIREPLNGKESIIPLRDRSFATWICSPRTLVANLIHTLKIPRSSLPLHDRAINMPGIGVTIQGMMDVLEKVGGKDKLSLVKEVPDPAKEKILRSWASRFDNSKAYKLGYQRDPGFEQAVVEYKRSLK